MQISQRLLLLGAIAGVALSGAFAQEPDPAFAPGPGPAQAATQNTTSDLDTFREPGSSTKLFPPQSTSPAPSTAAPGINGGNGRRNNGLLNNNPRRRNGRTNDMIGDQADADPLEVRVAYRRAKTIAMVRDPGLTELLRQAELAGTDVQKRVLLREYYTRLFDGVRAVDRTPEMKKHVRLLSQVVQQRYDPQRRAVGGDEDIVRANSGGRRGRTR